MMRTLQMNPRVNRWVAKKDRIFTSPLANALSPDEYFDRAVFASFSPIHPTFPIVFDGTGYPKSRETDRAILEDYHESDLGLSSHLLGGGTYLTFFNPFSILSCGVTCMKYSCFSVTDAGCQQFEKSCEIETDNPNDRCFASPESASLIPKLCCQLVCLGVEMPIQALNASAGKCLNYTCCVPVSSLCGRPLEDSKPTDSKGVFFAKAAAKNSAACRAQPVCCPSYTFDRKRASPFKIFVAPPPEQTMDVPHEDKNQPSSGLA